MVAHWGTRPLFILARAEQVCRKVCSVYQTNVLLGSMRQIPARDAGGAPDLPAVGSFSVGVAPLACGKNKNLTARQQCRDPDMANGCYCLSQGLPGTVHCRIWTFMTLRYQMHEVYQVTAYPYPHCL